MHFLRALLCGLSLWLVAPFCMAQTTDDAAPAPEAIQAPAMPAKGLSMVQVEKKLGAPKEKQQPVGNPPITRWVYPGYTVYFENSHVIHSVVDKKRSTP